MFGFAAAILIANAAMAQTPAPTAPSVVTVFAESCAISAGDRLALQRIAEARGWTKVAFPADETFDRAAWAEAYAVGPSTIFQYGHDAARLESPSGIISVSYPAGSVCGVTGPLQEGWREPLAAIAEERLGMDRSRPIIRRDPDADFQTALWRKDGGYIEAEYRRRENFMRIVWMRPDDPQQAIEFRARKP